MGFNMDFEFSYTKSRVVFGLDVCHVPIYRDIS